MRLSTERLLRALSAAGLIFVINACATGPYIWVRDLPKDGSAVALPGTIVPGDLVEVRVYGEEPLTTRARVRGDGIITLPLLGEAQVVGQRPAALAAALATRFTPYVNSPHVTVVVLESEITVTVLGEVKQVGLLTLQAPATVLQALAKTGGPTDFADRSKLFVLRTIAGRPQRIRFTYDALVGGDPASVKFRLQAGDTLIVE